jgi:hypothetical protein
MGWLAYGLYLQLNSLRTDVAEYAKGISIPWARDELGYNWDEDSYSQFSWNEGIARAARHVLNE